jgi:hypothetical protein
VISFNIRHIVELQAIFRRVLVAADAGLAYGGFEAGEKGSRGAIGRTHLGWRSFQASLHPN